MIKLYYKKSAYKLKTTKENFIAELKKSTQMDTENIYSHNEKYIFRGRISENDFELQSVYNGDRRYIFYPLIIGNFKEKNNETILSVELKLLPISYIFILMFFIVCLFFGIIIYFCSLENSNLIPLIFILPPVIFSLINCMFLISIRMNFSDALYNIEHVIDISQR